ncbi:MAG TPA: hypothetical protein VIO80_14310 [Candidatus Dormibacteraeota bacterium]
MSQMPPPPPGQPAPMGGTPAAAGSNKNLYTILAWVLFPPIGSLIFLFIGKDDPDVKYNAANATVIHGAALAIYLILWVLTVVTVFLGILLILWSFIWFVIWVIGLILALQAGGKRFAFPGLQGLASKYVPMVEGWAK